MFYLFVQYVKKIFKKWINDSLGNKRVLLKVDYGEKLLHINKCITWRGKTRNKGGREGEIKRVSERELHQTLICSRLCRKQTTHMELHSFTYPSLMCSSFKCRMGTKKVVKRWAWEDCFLLEGWLAFLCVILVWWCNGVIGEGHQEITTT